MGWACRGRRAAARLQLRPLLCLALFLMSTDAQSCGCPDCEGGHCGHAQTRGQNSSVATGAREECGTVGGGQGEILQDRHPYMASLLRPGTHDHICTGILVHHLFVLTAGHCVDPENHYSAGYRPIVALGGSLRDGEPKQIVVAESSMIFPGWKEHRLQRSSSNLALVKLPSPAKRVTPVMLSNHLRIISGQWLQALGWGSTDAGPELGQPIFSDLKSEDQEAITWEDCKRSSLWDGQISDGLICGLKRTRRASCLVDSGSPIMLLDAPGGEVSRGLPDMDIVVGVTIDGAPCNDFGKPDVYVDIRARQRWIQQQIGVIDRQ